MIGNKDCQKPGCNKKAEHTYIGKQDNTLKLCERHYYNLVSNNSGGFDINITESEPVLPFWDDGVRCSTTSGNSIGGNYE